MMNTSMNAAANSTRELTSDQLVDDLKRVADDANRLIRDVGNYPVERLSAARFQLEEKFRLAKSRVDDLRNTTVDKTRYVADATHDYVTENPWKSLGILAAATAVVALLITRR